jgi:hypothetical protein
MLHVKGGQMYQHNRDKLPTNQAQNNNITGTIFFIKKRCKARPNTLLEVWYFRLLNTLKRLFRSVSVKSITRALCAHNRPPPGGGERKKNDQSLRGLEVKLPMSRKA